MEAFRKVLHSKTLAEAIKNIPCSFFDIASFVIFALFAANPLLKLINDKLFPPLFMHWRTYNRLVLAIGGALLILYILKLWIERKHIDIKGFLKDNIPIAIFGIFTLLMLISTAVNGFTPLSLLGSNYRSEGLFGYLSYIVYFLLAVINMSEKLKKLWLYWFVGTSAVLEMYTLIDFYAFGHYDFKFVFDQYNHYGYYLLMSLAVSSMLAVISKNIQCRILFSLSAALSTWALIINDTFGCQLAAAAGVVILCVVYSIAKGRFKLKTLIPAAVFVLTFAVAAASSPVMLSNMTKNYSQIGNDVYALAEGTEEAEHTTGISRIILWENTCNYISERPVFGFGADGTGNRLKEDTHDNDRCHCEYLNYAVCFGIPAAIVYIAAVFLVYLRGLKYRKKLTELNLLGLCAAMFYLCSAVVGNSMYSTAPFLFILLGFGYYRKTSTETSAPEK